MNQRFALLKIEEQVNLIKQNLTRPAIIKAAARRIIELINASLGDDSDQDEADLESYYG